LWPQQNHFMLAIMSAFGIFVSLNLMTACFLLPNLVKMLFGIESVFTRSGLSLLNSTFFFATFGLAYLCVDPIFKTIYALRCFYGESQRSGADLRADLRRTGMPAAGIVLLALVVLSSALGPANAPAAEPAQTSQSQPLAEGTADGSNASSSRAVELDRTIQQVVQEPKYAWRQPRQKLVEPGDQEQGFFGRMLDRIKPFLKSALKGLGEWLDWFFRRWFGSRTISPGHYDASGWVKLLHVMVYGLIAAAAVGLGWLAYRIWNNGSRAIGSVTSEPLAPIPDLSDENLGADQLPEDGWMKVGHALLAEGKLRLALRAFYLASLAQLASKNLIQLARFKSNSDYERELGKRAHALPGLVSTFGDNSLVFDRTWYGNYEVSPDMVTGFAAGVERMHGLGTAPTASPGRT
jgi:hypothetical protein